MNDHKSTALDKMIQRQEVSLSLYIYVYVYVFGRRTTDGRGYRSLILTQSQRRITRRSTTDVRRARSPDDSVHPFHPKTDSAVALENSPIEIDELLTIKGKSHILYTFKVLLNI